MIALYAALFSEVWWDNLIWFSKQSSNFQTQTVILKSYFRSRSNDKDFIEQEIDYLQTQLSKGKQKVGEVHLNNILSNIGECRLISQDH